MNGKQLAALCGCTPALISQLKKRIIDAGHTETIDGVLNYKESAVEWVKNRPKKQTGAQGNGLRQKQNKALSEAIKNQLGFYPEIVLSYTKPKGWFYYNQKGEPVFLGKNFNIAVNNISYILG